MSRTSAEAALERAASVANIAMLRANGVPNSIQIETINELTSLLESELAALRPDDASTSEARGKILAQLAIHRGLLAPIRRLPIELLCEIFFLAAHRSSLHTLRVAATIARVCTAWRRLAHGLTKLWTKVVARSLKDLDQYCELFLPITTQERRPALRCDNPEILRDLWDRIESCASCWGSITIEGQLSMLPDLQVLYMENLDRLVINAYDAPMSPELSVLDFVVAPRLRHIAITLDALQSERQLHVPMAGALTSIDIDVMTPFPVTHTFCLLQACAETLQSLTLKVRYPLDGPEGSYPSSASTITVMGALNNLRLVDPACALLNHITAPLIDELILSNVPAYGTRYLLGFLKRSQASRCLEVLRVYVPEEQDVSAWIPCFQLLDSLQDLHFDAMLSNREFLELLVRHADRPPILPSLQNIAMFRIFAEHKELRDTLRTLMKSRSKRILYNGRPGLEILGWIRD